MGVSGHGAAGLPVAKQMEASDHNNNNMYFLYSAIPTGPLLMALYSIILINQKY